MTDSDNEEVRVVSEGGVTVEKSFAAEEFPVPAVKFVLRSTVTEPVTVRLTDDVPESFSMDGIGFHPEYGSDDWNAYGDNRVEYERTLSPGEEVLTVYGVRLENQDATPADFLDDPALECVADASADVETPDDILGRETTSAVRDALAADGPLSGVDSEEASAGSDPAPRALSDDATPAVTSPVEDGSVDPKWGVESEAESGSLDLEDPTESDRTESEPGEAAADGTDARTPAFDLEDPTEADADGAGAEAADARTGALDLDDPSDPDPAPVPDEADGDDEVGAPDADDAAAGVDALDAPAEDDAVADAPVDDAVADTPDDDDAGADARADVAAGSLASALAEEIRAGDVDDEDLELLRSELEFESVMPKSADVRISRLQSRTEDLAAYSDALAEFLDEEGSGQELIESFREDVAAVESELADLESSVSTLDEDHESLATEVDRVDGAVDGASNRLDDHDARLATLDDRIADAEATAETVREDLATDVADVQEEVEKLRREVEDLRSFRDRLGDVLGQ